MPRFTPLILTILTCSNHLIKSTPHYYQHYTTSKALTTMSQPHSHVHDHAHCNHEHPHHHSDQDTQAIFAKANAEHYDTVWAKKCDDNPFFQSFGKNLAEAITKVYPFDKERTKVLDYACGTGTFS